MRYCWIFLVTAFLVGLPVVAPGAVNGITAVVHDAVITQDDVEIMTEQTADMIFRDFRRQPELLEKKLNESRGENLKQLINRKMILHEFKSSFNVPEAVIDKDVERIIREDLRVILPTDDANNRMAERIRSCLAVAVHVRWFNAPDCFIACTALLKLSQIKVAPIHAARSKLWGG